MKCLICDMINDHMTDECPHGTGIEDGEGMVLSQFDKVKELYMMQTPANWPICPVLPLKRNGGNWELGFLIEDNDGVKPLVFVGSALTGEVKEQMLYNSWESLLTDGWRVD